VPLVATLSQLSRSLAQKVTKELLVQACLQGSSDLQFLSSVDQRKIYWDLNCSRGKARGVCKQVYSDLNLKLKDSSRKIFCFRCYGFHS